MKKKKWKEKEEIKKGKEWKEKKTWKREGRANKQTRKKTKI